MPPAIAATPHLPVDLPLRVEPPPLLAPVEAARGLPREEERGFTALTAAPTAPSALATPRLARVATSPAAPATASSAFVTVDLRVAVRRVVAGLAVVGALRVEVVLRAARRRGA